MAAGLAGLARVLSGLASLLRPVPHHMPIIALPDVAVQPQIIV